MMTWGTRRRLLDKAARLARKSGQRVARVACTAPEAARRAGQKLARKVVSIQRAARLPEHLVHRSAWSVTAERWQEARPSDAAWRQGYLEMAGAMLAPSRQRPAVLEADDKEAE